MISWSWEKGNVICTEENRHRRWIMEAVEIRNEPRQSITEMRGPPILGWGAESPVKVWLVTPPQWQSAVTLDHLLVRTERFCRNMSGMFKYIACVITKEPRSYWSGHYLVVWSSPSLVWYHESTMYLCSWPLWRDKQADDFLFGGGFCSYLRWDVVFQRIVTCTGHQSAHVEVRCHSEK